VVRFVLDRIIISIKLEGRREGGKKRGKEIRVKNMSERRNENKGEEDE
jgi:hypothetical protein